MNMPIKAYLIILGDWFWNYIDYMSINEFTKMSNGKIRKIYHKELVDYETESKGFSFI